MESIEICPSCGGAGQGCVDCESGLVIRQITTGTEQTACRHEHAYCDGANGAATRRTYYCPECGAEWLAGEEHK